MPKISDVDDAEAEPAFENGWEPTLEGQHPMFESDEVAPKSGSKAWIGCGAIGVLLIAGAVAAFQFGVFDRFMASEDAKPSVTTPSVDTTKAAFATAMEKVQNAQAIDSSFPGLLAAARALEDDDAIVLLLEKQFDANPTVPTAKELIERYSETGETKRIAEIKKVVEGLPGAEALDQIEAATNRPVVADGVPVRLEETAKFVRPFGGKTPGYEFTQGGQTVLFFPSKEPKAERRILAGTKLCQLIDCPFEHSFVAASVAVDAIPEAARQSFVVEEGRYVGAMQSVVLGDDFPIEATALWRPWLSTRGGDKLMDLPANEQLADSPNEIDMKDATVRDVARQISGILSYDYLVNNWGRWSDSKDNLGGKIHVSGGRLYSVASPVAFEPRASTRVKGRFAWIDRFDPVFIEKIRGLEKQATLDTLFPDASAQERSRFNVFWKQRESLLERVDSLAKRAGTDTVLSLDAK